MTTMQLQAQADQTAEVQELNSKAVQQVSDILADAERRDNTRQTVRPAMSYRVPMPGVRYYF